MKNYQYCRIDVQIGYMILKALKSQTNSLKNPERGKQMMKFFKTGPGEYGQGDIFIGLSNPQCRELAKIYKKITLPEIEELIQSQIHEERMIALVMMADKYKQKSETQKDEIFELYLKRIRFINNWDLVDLSAPHIVGPHLLQKMLKNQWKNDHQNPLKILYEWVDSPNMWIRRISIISTFTFIRANHFEDTLRLSQRLLGDKEDILHKATGWMLREVGKRDEKLLLGFLRKHNKQIPRTAFRYAIQKFEEGKRKMYLKGDF